MMIGHATGVRRSSENQEWRKARLPDAPQELRGKTILVIGRGPLAKEMTRRGSAFELRVRALTSLEEQTNVADLLRQADAVVLAGVAGDAKAELFGDKQIQMMKPTAQLINVGRMITDLAALRTALETKTIAAAGFEIPDADSLPVDHPLWRMNNVLIIPRSAEQSVVTSDGQWRLWRENVRRFAAGEPLLGVIESPTK